ncbi:MAG: aldo/keto reductase [Bacteroidetes bacterium]|nr:MAG: aldo/keto reductase [Bacteroidota bacterium]
MQYRNFGKTDLLTSVIGLGAGQIGDGKIQDENFVGWFLNQLVDRGINLIDTARMYGLSEERIGWHLSWRRKDFILSTKVGYDIPYQQDWTYDCVREGIEQALQRMRTDYIDILHLHSCSKEILQRGEAIEALSAAKQAGKIRFMAYSGENEDLEYALQTQRFDAIQCSANIFDQRGIDSYIKTAAEQGLGVIAKRPIGNAPWRYEKQPFGIYGEDYWLRMKAMNLPDLGSHWSEIALRFTAFTEGISACIVGTTNMQNVEKNIRILEKGKLSDDILKALQDAFAEHGKEWEGRV